MQGEGPEICFVSKSPAQTQCGWRLTEPAQFRPGGKISTVGSPAEPLPRALRQTRGQRSYSAVSERLELFSRPRCVAGPSASGPSNRLARPVSRRTTQLHRFVVHSDTQWYYVLHE